MNHFDPRSNRPLVMSSARIAAVTAALFFAGCATVPQKPLRTESVKLGVWRANYRDYVAAKRDLCESEQRWLAEELLSVNALVSKWVEATTGTRDDEWSNAKLELLAEGASTLPPILEIHEKTLRALEPCGFAKTRGFPDLRSRGLELVKEAEERITSGKEIRAWVRYKRGLERWNLEQPIRVADAMTLCPERSRIGQAILFYALVTKDGDTRYEFCDGSAVLHPAGGEPAYEAPIAATARHMRRVKKKLYLQEAAKFPSSYVDRPPAPPTEESGLANRTAP